MKYKLTTKSSDEAISTVDAGGVKQAKFFFMGRKNLSETEFDKLYVVQKVPIQVRINK